MQFATMGYIDRIDLRACSDIEDFSEDLTKVL